jgi:hypothetical protein
MGYHLTNSLACPSTRSHASPKTHVPGSRLQERGLRFYNTELSRWISRDPINEKGFQRSALWNRLLLPAHSTFSHTYMFNKNGPTYRVDPIGLADQTGVADPCAEYAQKFPEDEEVKKGGGTVVCKDGALYPCVWAPPGTHAGIVLCAKQHEERHAETQGVIVCPKCSFGRGTFKDDKTGVAEECSRYKEELGCLGSKKEELCSQSEGEARTKCEDEFDKRIAVVRGWKEYWCDRQKKESVNK